MNSENPKRHPSPIPSSHQPLCATPQEHSSAPSDSSSLSPSRSLNLDESNNSQLLDQIHQIVSHAITDMHSDIRRGTPELLAKITSMDARLNEISISTRELVTQMKNLSTKTDTLQNELRWINSNILRIQQLSDDRDQARSERSKLEQENHILRHQIQELNNQLQIALQQAAAASKVKFSRGGAKAGPQHDQIARQMQYIENQLFRNVINHFTATLDRYRAVQLDETSRRYFISRCFYHLSFHLISQSLTPQVKEALESDLQREFAVDIKRLPNPFPDLDQVIKACQKLQTDIANTDPKGRLEFIIDSLPLELFDSSRHEPISSCPDDPSAYVKFSLFPGYVVDDDNRVFVKARVWTIIPNPLAGKK